MKVLGIETTCDETGIAVYDSEAGLLGNVLSSQAELHAPYGGVVPELASRDHIRKVIPLIQQVLGSARLRVSDLEGIAYAAGPGLMGALLVGSSIGKSLGFALDIPTIGVHHMEAHLLAPMLDGAVPFPFVALLVSGGHTLLVRVNALGKYKPLGESLDDSAGEAFDKVAKLLGLPYPGGPALEALAKRGRPNRFRFPRPMIKKPGLNFSFSGLKTRVAQTVRSSHLTDQLRADIALAFQTAVIETLVIKARRAIERTGLNRLVVAGGVSANQALRDAFRSMASATRCSVTFPRIEFATDNGAMIAYAGCQRLLRGERDGDLAIRAAARWAVGAGAIGG